MYKFIKISILALGLAGFYSTNFVEASSEGEKIVLHEKEELKPLKASSLFLGCFDEPSSKKEKNISSCQTAEDLLADKIREENGVHYEKCASWGNPYGMNALGYLYASQVEDLLKQEESQENADKIVSLAHEAAQWHLLAFETYWLTKKGTYSDSAIDGLEELSQALGKKYKSKNKKYDDINNFKKGLLEIISNVNNFYKDYKNIKKIAGKYKNAFQFNGLNAEESNLKYYMFLTYVDPEETGHLLYESGDKFIESSLRYKKIKQCFEKSGSPDALYELGFMYKNGDIKCENPYEEAKKYWEKSGTPDAYYNLGVIYQKEGNDEKAKECYQQSKTPEALFNLGSMYELSHIKCNNEEERYQKVKYYFEKSGLPAALNNLGLLYQNKNNYEMAQKYFEKSNTPGALNNLGLLYARDKIKCKKPYEKAKEYFEKSGLPCALNNLGTLYIHRYIGISFAPLERYELALKCFQNALIGGIQEALEAEQECQKLIRDEQEVNKQEKNLNSEDNDTNNVIEETKSSSSDEEKDEHADINNEETEIKEEKTEKKVLEPKKKKTKEEIQEEKKQKKLLAFEKAKMKRDKTLEKMKEKFSFDCNQISSGINEAKPMRITFIDEKMRDKFLEVRRGEMGKKLQELIDDIKNCPWGLQGTGFSEVLKNDRSGQFSRRINGEDRLIYIPTENGIKILDCQGHYE
jgi:Txe/YoeB family toxin of toxin-antitoxin system